MRRASRLLVSIASLLGLVSLTLGQAGAQTRVASCGSVLLHYHERGTRQLILASKISATATRCQPARHVARAYSSRSYYARVTLHGTRVIRNRYPKGVGEYRCSDERLGSDIRTISCRTDSSTVEFAWYDSSPFH